MALIFDPMGNLVEIVGLVDDVLLFCDSDSDDEVAVLDAGAQAAGGLAVALRRAASEAPTLIAPDEGPDAERRHNNARPPCSPVRSSHLPGGGHPLLQDRRGPAPTT